MRAVRCPNGGYWKVFAMIPTRTPLELVAADRRFGFGLGGFIDSASLGDKPIVSASPGVRCGIVVDVFCPADPSERFPVNGHVVPMPFTSDCQGDVRSVDESATGRLDALTADVRLQARLSNEGTLTVHSMFSVSGDGWVAGMGLALPLIVDPDPLCRRTTVGGATRNETWRLDQNDEDTSEHWQSRVSDTKARWPLWRIGGLLVDAPNHYLIWKANGPTTSSLPMDHGSRCPGWIAYANRSTGLRLSWPEMHDHSPAGLTVNGETGMLHLWLHPPAIRPFRSVGILVRTAQFTLELQHS